MKLIRLVGLFSLVVGGIVQLASAQPASTPGNMLLCNGDSTTATINHQVIAPNASFTIEFWAQRFCPGHADIMFGTLDNGASNNVVHGGFREDNHFFIDFWANQLYAPVYTDTLWHHWACTFNGQTLQRTIYCDGASVASDVARGSYKGQGQLSLGTGIGYFAYAFMDEVRIWNVERSATDIQSNFTRSLTGQEAGLVAYYRLDEAPCGTTTIVDATGHGNGGSISSGTWLQSQAPFCPPSIATSAPRSITSTNAGFWQLALNSQVNLNNQALGGSVLFLFGPGTNNYSKSSVPTTSLLPMPTYQALYGNWNGALANGQYSLNVVVSNRYGLSWGQPVTFNIPPN